MCCRINSILWLLCLSYRKGILLDNWKRTTLETMFKKVRKQLAKKYRFIFLVSNFRKNSSTKKSLLDWRRINPYSVLQYYFIHLWNDANNKLSKVSSPAALFTIEYRSQRFTSIEILFRSTTRFGTWAPILHHF